jgi:hypothetical protein
VSDANQQTNTNETALASNDQSAAKHEDQLLAKQADKLDLEIKNLQKRNRWDKPIIATLLGVVGFFFTVFQFQCNRNGEFEKDRNSRRDAQVKELASREAELMTRLQNQFRMDIDEILHSAQNERQTTARFLFLLDDMKTVLQSKVNETQTFSDVFRNREREVTEELAILVRDDYDFSNNPIDVSRANALREHWCDYSVYLRSEPRKLDYILFKYTQALQNLRDRNPGYLECLTLDQETKQVRACRDYEMQKNEHVLYDHFATIVAGFTEHIEIFGQGVLKEADQKRKNKVLLDFQEAMCNQAVSTHFLGIYLPGGTCRNNH